MLELDGTFGEGGGALLRCALALSTLTQTPFKINNIRAGRPKGGLKAQHLTAIKALKEMSGAKSSDVALGTKEMWFHPGLVKSGTYTIDIGTAGSITLLLQSLILPCMFAPGKVTLEVIGGTCGKWQAGVDYLKHLLIPQLERFVAKIDLKILKRGYYPKGGGKIVLEISPKIKCKKSVTPIDVLEAIQSEVKPIRLFTQGNIEQVRGVVNLSSDLEEGGIGHRIVRAAQSNLSALDVPINISVETGNSLSSGGELILYSVHSMAGEIDLTNPIRLCGDALLDVKKSSEDVAKEAAQELLGEIKSEAACDEHLCDQLIQFMALLPASIVKTSKVSEHTKTNIHVAEKFLDVKFNIEGEVIKVEKK